MPFLHERGHVVVEVNRPKRQLRQRKGKDDTVDGEGAANSVLAGEVDDVGVAAAGAVADAGAGDRNWRGGSCPCRSSQRHTAGCLAFDVEIHPPFPPAPEKPSKRWAPSATAGLITSSSDNSIKPGR